VTGVRIDIKVDDRAVREALGKLATAAGDLTPAMRSIGAALVTSTVERFERQVSPAGLPWKKSARAEAEAGVTLTDTGRLRSSITFAAAINAVAIGTPVQDYAAIHQFGGEIRQYAYSRRVAFRTVKGRRLFARTKGNRAHKRVERQAVTYGERVIRMPARPYLGLSGPDRGEVLEILRRHLARATGGAA
jgi:phage virion morphogenesis protein